MTDSVNDALITLVHDLQFSKLPSLTRYKLYHQERYDDSTLAMNFRLDAAAVEYLQFNGYNLTTCVKYAISQLTHATT